MALYWIQGPGEPDYREVGRAEYVKAERRCGFYNTLGKPDEPATAAFTGSDGTRGTTIERQGQPIQLDGYRAVPGFDPQHHFYNPRGERISVDEWAELRKDPILRESPVSATTALRTVYIGFVDPNIAEARLFGSALVSAEGIAQVEVYDSEEEALLRHMQHVEAIAAGEHCALCKEGRPHTD